MFHQPIAIPAPAACPVDEHRHRPRYSSVRQDGVLRRGTCYICGVSIARTEATRIWFQTGAMG